MSFTLGERRRAEPRDRPGELIRGPYWAITRDGEEYVLCYLTADLAGREERVVLRESEVRAILGGDAAVAPYLPAPR